jgi:hypothetical protein
VTRPISRPEITPVVEAPPEAEPSLAPDPEPAREVSAEVETLPVHDVVITPSATPEPRLAELPPRLLALISGIVLVAFAIGLVVGLIVH